MGMVYSHLDLDMHNVTSYAFAYNHVLLLRLSDIICKIGSLCINIHWDEII